MSGVFSERSNVGLPASHSTKSETASIVGESLYSTTIESEVKQSSSKETSTEYVPAALTSIIEEVSPSITTSSKYQMWSAPAN
ncbi:MAG: Uncharacterised protein [Formosa sp. Hel3_A1_48]|nr:MAG: Uncharacterised protein [Formosa sp. Hel3_A1_48]